MSAWQSLLQNRVLLSAATGWLVAQVLKTLIHTFFTKSFDPERLIGSGGMPSSHSATVCALATSAGFVYGLDSFAFAISAIFAFIVMYDAMGVRLETGKQARLLNEITDAFKTLEGINISNFSSEKLKEFVGHTPIQVYAGAVLGILIGILLR